MFGTSSRMIFTRLQIFINILVVLSIFSVILSNYNDYDVVLIYICVTFALNFWGICS